MKVKKVKIVELMQALLSQLVMGIKYIDLEVVNEETLKLSPSEEDFPPNNIEPTINQTIV